MRKYLSSLLAYLHCFSRSQLQNNLFWKARCHRDFPAAIAHVARDKDWFKLYKATAWIARQHRVARTYLSGMRWIKKMEIS